MSGGGFRGKGSTIGLRRRRRPVEHASRTPVSAKKRRGRLNGETKILERDSRYYPILVGDETAPPERRAKVVDGETGKSVREPRPRRRTLMRCCEAMAFAEALNRKEREKR